TCSHPGSSDKSRWSSAFSRASTSANLQPRAVVSPVDCLWSWKVKEETNGEPQHHRRCQSFGHDLPFWSRKNACSEFQRGTRTRVQLTAPRTTALASARDRSRLLLCAVWLPITANQKPMFHGLLSAKNSPSEYPRCFRSSDE